MNIRQAHQPMGDEMFLGVRAKGVLKELFENEDKLYLFHDGTAVAWKVGDLCKAVHQYLDRNSREFGRQAA